MKKRAVHDRKSIHAVVFFEINLLICENEKDRDNDSVSDDILQYLQAKLLGLVKSGKFKRKESTVIWSKQVVYPKGMDGFYLIQTPGFSRTLPDEY